VCSPEVWEHPRACPPSGEGTCSGTSLQHPRDISAKSWVKQTLSLGSQIQVSSVVHAPISFKVSPWSLLRQNTVGRILATTSNLIAQSCLSLRATYHEHCQWEYPPLKQTTTKGARWGSFEFFLYLILEINLTAISRDFRYDMMAWYQALATCQRAEKNPPPDWATNLLIHWSTKYLLDKGNRNGRMKRYMQAVTHWLFTTRDFRGRPQW
jgi:hypothetical protein